MNTVANLPASQLPPDSDYFSAAAPNYYVNDAAANCVTTINTISCYVAQIDAVAVGECKICKCCILIRLLCQVVGVRLDT